MFIQPQCFNMAKPPIVLDKKDIGTTMVFCPMCVYKTNVICGAVPIFCPKCSNELLFMDVTEEFFRD
jgi:hypothetical protein